MYKILATIEHKEDKLTKDFKNKLINREEAIQELERLCIERDLYNVIIDTMYYKFNEVYNIKQALKFASEKGLDKWLVIKYFDSRYKKLFKVNKFFTKQYLELKSGANI